MILLIVIVIVHHNMPCVADFDVRPAVQAWMNSGKSARLLHKNFNIDQYKQQEYVTSFFFSDSNETQLHSILSVKF